MPRRDWQPTTLDNIIDDIENLKQARDLLERVWRRIGPYDRSGYFQLHDQQLLFDMQRYFDFDDSE